MFLFVPLFLQHTDGDITKEEKRNVQMTQSQNSEVQLHWKGNQLSFVLSSILCIFMIGQYIWFLFEPHFRSSGERGAPGSKQGFSKQSMWPESEFLLPKLEHRVKRKISDKKLLRINGSLSLLTASSPYFST